ncbi:MAG TPA: hypothetical protein VFY71_06535 [Planctomycetota bacterium]|nr:hypothetical protein [Planctomycetota bacterium]
MSRRVILSQVDPASLSRTLGLFYTVIGLIVGTVMLLVALIRSDGAAAGVAFLMFFLYPVLGFVAGWFTATLFNAIAGRWGGVGLELEEPDVA